MKHTKFMSLLLAVAMVACMLLTACAAPAPVTESPTPTPQTTPEASTAPEPTPAPDLAMPASFDTPEMNTAYLKLYYGIELAEELKAGDFVQALTASNASASLAEAQVDSTQPLTVAEAARLAVIGANMEALALVYTPDMIEATLPGIAAVDAEHAPFLACAVDNGLIPEAHGAYPAETMKKANAEALLLAVADANGKARTYIGYTSDADIAQKLNNAYETFELLDDKVLLDIGMYSVENKITTGYNLRRSDYDANFLPELTLRYGHSSIVHAQQLVGLLNNLGIVARVQLEPKTSIYEYLIEWGEPGEPSDTYKVEKVKDNFYLAHASEYDLVLEFATAEDKLAFDGVILTYAKKNTGEETKALLAGSWWQPLYVSHVEMGEGYNPIFDNVLTHGKYSLHPFSLPEAKDSVATELNKIDADVQVVSEPIWCNDAFFRYLNGESE